MEELTELAKQYRIMTIPTLMVWKNGQIVSQSSGAKPKEKILDMLV